MGWSIISLLQNPNGQLRRHNPKLVHHARASPGKEVGRGSANVDRYLGQKGELDIWAERMRPALLILAAIVTNALQAVWASGTPATERVGSKEEPNLLLVMLGGVPATALYTADEHAMSAPNAAFYAANLRFLERNAMVFHNAYVNIARSAPSRVSLLTSLHPRRQLNLMSDDSPASSFQSNKHTTFPSWLKSNAAMQTIAAGKVFSSMSSTITFGGFQQYAIPKMGDQDNLCGDSSITCVINDENSLTDDDIAERTISYLQTFARTQQRFALVVGFHRPYADKSYPTWASNQVEKRRHAILSQQKAQSYASQPNNFFTVDAQPGNMNISQVNNLKVGTYGTVQWIDYCLGRIIDELRGLRFWDNTIIIVTSDIAPASGEFSDLSTDGSAVYEHTTRVPLFIRDTRAPKSFGKKSKARVELVDVATTIYDLLGVKYPPNGAGSSKSELQGVSLKRLIDVYQNDPRKEIPNNDYYSLTLRHAAYSESARCTQSSSPFYGIASGSPVPSGGVWNDCASYSNRADVVAISMRNDKYRYTEYRTANPVSKQVVWESEGLVGRELFSHVGDDGLETSVDGNRFELENLAPCPDSVCNMVVPPNQKPTSPNPSVRLPNDPKSNDHYTAPALPQNSEHARLVRTFALMLRAAGRDGKPLCSNHGLVNPDTGACNECDNGWGGVDCALSAIPDIDPGENSKPPSFTPTTRPPVGAPTPPLISPTPSPTRATPAPTMITTPQPTPIVPCSQHTTNQHCLTSDFCTWVGNACREVATPSPLAILAKDSCSSLFSESNCRKVNGCIWQGKTGCQVPLPAACGCDSEMIVTTAFVLSDRGGNSGSWELFRNPCHATCRGALLPSAAPTKQPTRVPTTAAPTLPTGLPLPTAPGKGNALPVNTLTLYLIVDASSNIANLDSECIKRHGTNCIHVTAVFYERLVRRISEFVMQGWSKLRVGIWAYSCQSSEPIWVEIQSPLASNGDAVQEVLRGIRQVISARGGRCPSRVLDVILSHDEVERLTSPNRALVYIQSGIIQNHDLSNAKAAARRLRERGVATIALVVARTDYNQQVPNSRENALAVTGNPERVFNANSRQGILALTSMIDPVVAAILALAHEPKRVSAFEFVGKDIPDSFFTSDGYTDENEPMGPNGGSNTGAILGGIVAAMIVIAAAFMVYKRRKNAMIVNSERPIDVSNDLVISSWSSTIDLGQDHFGAPEPSQKLYEVAQASPMKTARRRSSADISATARAAFHLGRPAFGNKVVSLSNDPGEV